MAISAQSVEPYTDLRIVFFSISNCAVRAVEAENILNGKTSQDTSALSQALDALTTLNYFDDTNTSSTTKMHLARVVMQRALLSMTEVVG